jgi:hypothetical protein
MTNPQKRRLPNRENINSSPKITALPFMTPSNAENIIKKGDRKKNKTGNNIAE